MMSELESMSFLDMFMRGLTFHLHHNLTALEIFVRNLTTQSLSDLPVLFNRNLTANDLADILGPRRHALAKIIPITIAYTLIFVTGIIGNIITCFVIVLNKYMHTATNFYLFNLAISDILVLVLGLPQELYSLWSAYPWIFGEAFCLIRTMASETCTNVSVLTITAFTVERYVAICHPMFAQKMSRLSRAVKVIVVIWIIGCVSAIPLTIQFGIVYVRDLNGRIIHESASCNRKEGHELALSFEVSTFLFFCTPMAIITSMYVFIGVAIQRSSCAARSQVHYKLDRAGSPVQSKGRRSVIKMLAAVVLAFFICWAPFHAQRLMVVYVKRWSVQLLSVQNVLFYVSGVLYYTSSTINPILYNIMSLKFRQAFRNTLLAPCQKRRFRPQSSAGRSLNSNCQDQFMYMNTRISCTSGNSARVKGDITVRFHAFNGRVQSMIDRTTNSSSDSSEKAGFAC